MEDLQTRYGPMRELGARFGAASVAELYRHRPPYGDAVYARLLELLEGRRRVVLDCGCGTGKLARPLAPRVERVDAVDPSADMIRVGRALAGGEQPRLRWIESRIEEADLAPPYGLATAGASFHWFDTERVLSLLAETLEPGAFLVLVDGDAPWRPPWAQAEHELYMDFASRLRGERVCWTQVDLEQVRVLEHPRFELCGEHVTGPDPFEQSVADYVACQHSRATFTLEAMGPELARDFDRALLGLLEPHARDGRLLLQRRTRMEWGRPVR